MYGVRESLVDLLLFDELSERSDLFSQQEQCEIAGVGTIPHVVVAAVLNIFQGISLHYKFQ